MRSHLFSPINIRNTSLKNRIVFAPTSMGYGIKKNLEKLIEISTKDVGLIIIGDVGVRKGIYDGMFALDNDENIELFKPLVDEVHKNGSKISAQLFHPEYNLLKVKKLIGEIELTASARRKLMQEIMLKYANDLSIDEIEEINNLYVKSAQRAQQAGFDMIQVHGDHLLGTFSSSILNKRTDKYGQDLVGRARLSLEIVKNIKANCPDLIIDYKLTIRKENPNFGKGGPSESEIEFFVKELEKAGVDSFHVALANHGAVEDTIPSKEHLYFKDEGCFLELAQEVKKYTKLPVCGVGKLQRPEILDNIIEKNIVDLVGMSRQLIADSNWAKKTLNNQEESINYCQYCNTKCLGGLIKKTEFGCALHLNEQ